MAKPSPTFPAPANVVFEKEATDCNGDTAAIMEIVRTAYMEAAIAVAENDVRNESRSVEQC
jgi:hypothetical protein